VEVELVKSVQRHHGVQQVSGVQTPRTHSLLVLQTEKNEWVPVSRALPVVGASVFVHLLLWVLSLVLGGLLLTLAELLRRAVRQSNIRSHVLSVLLCLRLLLRRLEGVLVFRKTRQRITLANIDVSFLVIVREVRLLRVVFV